MSEHFENGRKKAEAELAPKLGRFGNFKPVKVIPYKVWVNKKNGRRASTGGAIPWTSDREKPDWEMVQEGYTLFMDNGTTGYGRPPFKTEREAQEAMDNWPGMKK